MAFDVVALGLRTRKKKAEYPNWLSSRTRALNILDDLMAIDR